MKRKHYPFLTYTYTINKKLDMWLGCINFNYETQYKFFSDNVFQVVITDGYYNFVSIKDLNQWKEKNWWTEIDFMKRKYNIVYLNDWTFSDHTYYSANHKLAYLFLILNGPSSIRPISLRDLIIIKDQTTW